MSSTSAMLQHGSRWAEGPFSGLGMLTCEPQNHVISDREGRVVKALNLDQSISLSDSWNDHVLQGLPPCLGFVLFCLIFMYVCMWASQVVCGKESDCQCRRRRFNPWSRKIPWRRKWRPTPVFLPGKSYGQRRLVGYSSWGGKESDRTEQLSVFMYLFERAPVVTYVISSCCMWDLVPQPGMEPGPPALGAQS